MKSRKSDNDNGRQKAHHADDDDPALFRRLMADARRLKSDTAPPHPHRVRPQANFTRRDRHEVLRESLEADPQESDRGAGETLGFRHPAVSRATMRRLARGGFSIQAEIDLHGLTSNEAREKLQEFVADSVARNYTCIRIVHGKGHRSGQAGPVLKRMVDRSLRRLPPVLAFVSARPVDGGSGAVYVLLRREQPSR